MKYAVLEWEEGRDDVASVICRNQSKEFAETMVRIAPPHLPREIITMDQLQTLDKVPRRETV